MIAVCAFTYILYHLFFKKSNDITFWRRFWDLNPDTVLPITAHFPGEGLTIRLKSPKQK